MVTLVMATTPAIIADLLNHKKINKMKKQTKKLSLNKKTISNLHSSEMSRVIGASGWWCSHSCNYSCAHYCGTKNGNTCPGHNTCYNC